MQQPKGDLLLPVIASLTVGALVSGSIVYAVTGMRKDEEPVAVATATPTATPSATVSPTPTPTATPATTKDFTYRGKVLFSYPAEYTLSEVTKKYMGGGGSLLSVEFGVQNATTGTLTQVPVSISELAHGAPTEAPALDTLLPTGWSNLDGTPVTSTTGSNSKGTKYLISTAKDLGGSITVGVVTAKNNGYRVTVDETFRSKEAEEAVPSAKLRVLFDQIMDTISL